VNAYSGFGNYKRQWHYHKNSFGVQEKTLNRQMISETCLDETLLGV
jgi:hypothetical protein